MALPALYKLTDDFNKLMEIEEDQDVIDALIAIVAGEIEAQSENICKFIKILETTALQFKTEEKRIADKRKTLENQSERIRVYLRDALLSANINKLTAGTFKVSIGLSPGSVAIDDLASIPPQFLTVIPEQYIPNKIAIKAAIKNDPHSVPGAHIESGFSLRIS